MRLLHPNRSCHLLLGLLHWEWHHNLPLSEHYFYEFKGVTGTGTDVLITGDAIRKRY